ncbi:MAG: hypothetical protein P8N57_07485 [Flavobacteriaceae bacterium]|nr:hypothetical protein [Flavobacteriaceae bacterium]
MIENRILTMHPKGIKGVNILERLYALIKDFILKKVELNHEISYQKISS